MSHEALAFVKTLNVPISSHKLLLMALAERISNETGECFPGQALLMRECSKSERQIRYILTGLEEAGVIVRRKRKKANGHADSDAYTITGFMQWLSIVDSLKVGDAEAATKKLIELQVLQRQAENPTGNGLPVGDETRARTSDPTGNGLPVANRQWAAGKPSEENPHTQPLTVVGDTPTTASPKRRKKQGELLKPEAEAAQEQRDQKRRDGERDEAAAAFKAYVNLAKVLKQPYPGRFAASYRDQLIGILNLEGEWAQPNGSVCAGRLGLAGWCFALKKIKESAWCRGERKSPTGAVFELIFEKLASEKGIVQVLSGRFDDRKSKGEARSIPGSRFTPDQWRIRIRNWISSNCVAWSLTDWGPRIGEDGCLVSNEVLEDPEFKDRITEYLRSQAA